MLKCFPSEHCGVVVTCHDLSAGLWWKRLFRSIDLNINQKLSVLCDNNQTVDLLTKVNSLFRTKLKHIDIHHHWLRQEILAGNLEISWIPTNLMPADGLTKQLSYQKHQLSGFWCIIYAFIQSFQFNMEAPILPSLTAFLFI